MRIVVDASNLSVFNSLKFGKHIAKWILSNMNRFAQIILEEMLMKKYTKPSLKGLGLLRVVTKYSVIDPRCYRPVIG